MWFCFLSLCKLWLSCWYVCILTIWETMMQTEFTPLLQSSSICNICEMLVAGTLVVEREKNKSTPRCIQTIWERILFSLSLHRNPFSPNKGRKTNKQWRLIAQAKGGTSQQSSWTSWPVTWLPSMLKHRWPMRHHWSSQRPQKAQLHSACRLISCCWTACHTLTNGITLLKQARR